MCGLLTEIGQVLRHQSLRTTEIYAKADLIALRHWRRSRARTDAIVHPTHSWPFSKASDYAEPETANWRNSFRITDLLPGGSALS
jgi:hypothetical protein